MQGPGSSAGDTQSCRGDQSSRSGSGAQDSGDVTAQAEDNASVLNGPDRCGIPLGCEGPDDGDGALVEKAALVDDGDSALVEKAALVDDSGGALVEKVALVDDSDGALVEKAALVEMPPHDSEQVGESQESPCLEFGLTVPFLSYMDAEIARLYLIQEEDPLEGAVHTELRVSGSDLIIRVTSENSSLLYNSVCSLLSHLSTVVTALRFFAPEYLAPSQE